MKNKNTLSGASHNEKLMREDFLQLFAESPIAKSEILQNMGVFLNRMNLSKILLMNELYQKIINVHGIVIEFGVRWGQNLSLFSNFRGIYEPYNYNRKIVGFDTFEGFININKKDGSKVKVGDYSVSDNYEDYLTNILSYHESESPISHKKKFELIKGDASVTFKEYLESHPETIVAFAYFDFDLYKPTKDCLSLLLPRVTKGSVIAFDELNCPEFPGETLALLETLGLSKYAIQRSPLTPLVSYIVVD